MAKNSAGPRVPQRIGKSRVILQRGQKIPRIGMVTVSDVELSGDSTCQGICHLLATGEDADPEARIEQGSRA